jgi:hypothetical protein
MINLNFFTRIRKRKVKSINRLLFSMKRLYETLGMVTNTINLKDLISHNCRTIVWAIYRYLLIN